MNIIFLDIDGVMLSWKRAQKRAYDGDFEFLQNAINSLNRVAKSIDAKVVIISTWRETRTLKYFQDLFDGRKINVDIIGMTDVLNTGRASEIQKWIDENSVEYFIIIDDNTREIEKHFKSDKNVLRTGLYRGLDQYDVLYIERAYELYTKKKMR